MATAVAVAVAVLVPPAVLGAQVWSTTGRDRGFTADERRGVAYLAPVTQLLAATTQAQSDAVRGKPVDAGAVRGAVTAVDRVDARLGDRLQTTDRWTTVRQTVQARLGVTDWQPATAYTQYSDLNTALLELTRAVGDNSRLILDPGIDAYYVMNASLLRIPEILVDSGRYADLSVLFPTGADDATRAQLAAARNRIATDETDLSDGLVKAFAQTDSETLGPSLTRQLDNFRTAVDAVAPSASLLAPVPERSVTDLIANQQTLQRSALSLQDASLDQLDAMLADRAGGQTRSRVLALVALVVAVLVAAGVGWLLLHPPAPLRPRRQAEPDDPAEDVLTPAAYGQTNGAAVPVRSERSGGTRAAR